MPDKRPPEYPDGVVEVPDADPKPWSAPGPKAAAPKWSPPVCGWLNSEFVNGNHYFGFEPGAPLYESAIWPLGMPFGNGKTDAELSLWHMVDLHFDYIAKRAAQLPMLYSGLPVRIHSRREGANLVIRKIGHWDGEAPRNQEIVSTLARRRRMRRPDDLIEHVTYAITPFCIIGQTWVEESQYFPASPGGTSIALFYTYETFIQECLAIDARRAGIPTAEIVAAYEHRYNNVTRHKNLLLRDPAQLRLARYANQAIDWSRIATTPEDMRGATRPDWLPHLRRRTLFECRHQTHLMVAIAAAFHSLATFANGHASSPLVRTTDTLPDLNALAPHWLGHVLGDYDHTAACADLVKSLAAHYQQDLSGHPVRSMPMPPFRDTGDGAERTIRMAGSPFGHDCLVGETYDTFRWNLFDATLDDAAVTRWAEELYPWLRS